MAILSFNERVAIAVGLVRDRFPGARLHQAEGASSTGPTSTPMAIDRLRVLFRNGDGTVLLVEETGYGEFGPLRRLDPPPSLRGPIDWPIDMELSAADNLKEDAAWIDPYVQVVLRAGRGGGAEFVFGGAAGTPEVIVDASDGSVREA
jgi:hypothetical protein